MTNDETHQDNRIAIRFMNKSDFDFIQTRILRIFKFQTFATTPQYLLSQIEAFAEDYLNPDRIAADLGFPAARAEYFVAFYRRVLDEIEDIIIFRDDSKEIQWRTFRLSPPNDEEIDLSAYIVMKGKTLDKFTTALLYELVRLEQ